MEIDTITGYEGNREDKESEGSLIEEDDKLFFMEPDYEEVRAKEDPDAQGYWETGLTMESLNATWTIHRNIAIIAVTRDTSRQIVMNGGSLVCNPRPGSKGAKQGRHS